MPAQTDSDEPVAALDAVETDAGPPRAGKAASRDPERRCIATMERRRQGELIRFVLAPDKTVTPDVSARLPGRGAWVTANRESLDLAVKRGAFARAFKAQVKLPPDLSAQTESLLARRALDMLGMAKRSGELILGFEQVREAVRASRPAAVITAGEVSADQRSKVLNLVKGIYGPAMGQDLEDDPAEDEDDTLGDDSGADSGRIEQNRPLPPVVDCFSGDELGMALGRERVVHACLKQGRIAHAWMGELARLSGFRRVWLPGWQPASAPDTGASGPDIEDATAHDPGGNPPDAST